MRHFHPRARPAHPAATPSCAAAGQHDDALPPDLIDGTLGGMRAFLAEMAALVDAADGAESVLELLLGDILTFSTVTQESGGGLAIFACLPHNVEGNGGIEAGLAAAAAAAGCECLWHAERGCVVLARTVPLAALRDEPGVLDAIMQTAGMAGRLGAAPAPDGVR